MSFDDNHENKKKTKRSLYNILDKEGFYIILFLCVCIVAVTAVWVSNQNQNPLVGEGTEQIADKEEAPDVTLVEGKEKDTVNDSSEAAAKPVKEGNAGESAVTGGTGEPERAASAEEAKNSQAANKQVAAENLQSAAVAASPSVKADMLIPVTGRLGLVFADDHLVYHETLEQWSTHKGIDIHAEEGTPVRAALDGEVIEVLNDTIMGITISILHDNEIITKYSNLSTDSMVALGQRVNKGQIISGVGKTAAVKTVEGPLLHFQVIADGRPVDPQLYLQSFNN